MSAKKRQAPPPTGPVGTASPAETNFSGPRPSRWQLIVSSVLMALWMIFLAWMAFGG